MATADSKIGLHDSSDADALRLEQLRLEAKAARLEAEAKALEAKLTAKKSAAEKPRSEPAEAVPPQVEKPASQIKPPTPVKSKPAAEPKAETPAPKRKSTESKLNSPPPRKEPAAREISRKEAPAKKVDGTTPAVGAVAGKATSNGTKAETKPRKPEPPREAAQPKAEATNRTAPPKKVAPASEPTSSQPMAAAASALPVDELPADLPPSDPPAEDNGEEHLEEQGPGFISRMIRSTPSYMVSAVFHLVALLILAMIMLPLPKEVTQLVVEASALEETEELEEVIIDSLDEQLEMVELEEPITAQPVDIADPGAADLGAIAQEVPSEIATYGVAMNDTNIDSIGTLFGSEGEGMADALDGAGGAEFFGVKASGRKFVFIVDSSLSMKNGKFEAACEELMYSISRLSKDQYFYVLFFDHDAARLTFDGKDEPEERCVPATSVNIRKTGQWVRTVELELRTDPYDCVEFAMKLLPDAIYILTDGKFTDKGKTVRWLKKENLYEDPIDGTKQKVIIHTVGFYQRDGEPTLKPLAALHGGTYRFVPKPGNK